ncbi:cupin domain-containing protein [Herbaspirillum lusitanum]|jgi:mannose-6-phosphate isomerase-like protein (cupin superfamily)|uniref:Cupin domain-containing protein n=1 Tax=Herbaspirillum lusitanum TaxID=213312 RepID=A0ABW9AE20_9BURK
MQFKTTKKGIAMRQKNIILSFAVVGAFAAGMAASPLAQHLVADAHAEQAPLVPAVIDLNAITHAALPATPYPELRSKILVNTDNATVNLQSGNVGKHIHAKTDEIQYIVEGTGSMWLGGELKEFKPGTLIIIPKGTAHAGAVVTSGPVKAIAIKIPPQAKDDISFVN